MIAVVDRLVQYPNRYKLTNAETGEVLGTFDFEEKTGTVQQVGTEINKALFDSIATDLAERVKLSGGELSGTIVTFSDISGTAANVSSGDTSATLWGKVKNWFSRLKALAFKDTIRNSDVASNAAIAQSKISGLESALAAKQNTITGGASTITSSNLTSNRVLVSNGSGKVGVSAVTSTELGYLDGVTSNIQVQFNNSGKINSSGGFQGGTGADAGFGGAIGYGANATYGGAIGRNASATTGGAVGSEANATYGGAVGATASATTGGAIGQGASATTGFAGGYSAKAMANGAVQLGTGANKTENTLQFRGYQIVDANGNIPAERLSNINVPVTSVNGKTGAVSLSASDVGAATESYVNSQIAAAITTALNTAV